MRRYAHILYVLRQVGVIFQPMVWSAGGCPHPATVRVMECSVRAVKSRHGTSAAEDLRRRWRHEIAVAIQRRKAAMIRAALPEKSLRQEWLANGGRAAGEHAMLPPISVEHERPDV